MAKNLTGVICLIRKIEYLCVFLLGGTTYGVLEMLWRGFTHWSMVFAGGVCFLLIHLMNLGAPGLKLITKCAIGSVLITGVEFFTGVGVNIVLGLDVWDYSALPFNLLGQVCPQFMIVWFLLTCPACYLSGFIRKLFEKLLERERRVA